MKVGLHFHGYPAGTRCADIDLFHTVADRSNSFSLILMLIVLNASAFLYVFSSIRFMWVSVQISNNIPSPLCSMLSHDSFSPDGPTI